ncbi:hypothetical protein BGZ94_005087 [Podila epigama]|nr:hypothetical protein BGZ94_005087 [Podila epigama]
MTSKKDEHIRIIDRKQATTGIEYLYSVTGEWLPSSISRNNNPDLVELYEWLHSSGYRQIAATFSTIRLKSITARSARKRVRSSQLPGGIAVTEEKHPVAALESYSKINASNSDAANDGKDVKSISSANETPETELEPSVKKLKRQDSFIEGLNDMSITTDCVQDPIKQELSQENTSHGIRNDSNHNMPSISDAVSLPEMQQESNNQQNPKEASSTGNIKTVLRDQEKNIRETPQLVEFNRNTEHMIDVYFSEGMDASGVEMFDILLGPYRRPTKEFTAAFFYAIVLSPFTDVGTIEAALHVLDRTLSLHGSEPFQDFWDVQARRRELADGKSPFSKMASSSSLSSGPSDRMSSSSRSNYTSRLSAGSRQEASFSPQTISSTGTTRRLPSWNNIWELFKALLGLDTKPESRQYIAQQQNQIKLRMFGEVAEQVDPHGQSSADYPHSESESEELEHMSLSRKNTAAHPNAAVPEEQKVREEIGRAIVGFLLRVLEHDAIQKNLSSTSFFRRRVLSSDAYSSHTIKPALDSAFQLIGLATSSRYLKSNHHDKQKVASTVDSPAEHMHSRGGSKQKGKGGQQQQQQQHDTKMAAVWPLNERLVLNDAGLEILQLGQQILLLLVRYIQAGELLPQKGMDVLAVETLSRLEKLNRDRVLVPTEVHGAVDRYSLDVKETFFKGLIQGPSLLEAGTGAGAGVRLDHSNVQQGGSEGSEDNAGGNKDMMSRTSLAKVSMGSSTFVMTVADLWFRSKTTVKGGYHVGGFYQPLFRRVVEEYAMPCILRPNPGYVAPTPADAAASSTRDRGRRSERNKPVANHSKTSAHAADTDTTSQSNVKGENDGDNDLDNKERGHPEKWHAEDLMQIETIVMMTEVLVWSWIEAKGIRRQDIEGTGLESILFPGESNGSVDASSSGWLVMSNVLSLIGGTLKRRWESLETVIEVAITIEELGLR